MFILRHSNNEGNHVFSKVQWHSRDKSMVSTLPPPFAGTHVVVGFCNGIFLLEYVDESASVVVWNACFAELRILPPPLNIESPPCSHCDGTCRVEVSSRVCGIGFHSGDYKVLRLTSTYYHHTTDYYPACLIQAQVYSLTNKCWEEIEISSDECSKYDVFGCPIYIGSCCYWMVEVDGGRVIASFSFITEKFSSIDVPQIILDECYESELVEIEGTLGIVVYPLYGNDKHFSYLVLRGGSWTRKTEYDVRLVGVKRFLGFYYSLLLLEGRDGELLVYDYEEKKLNRFDQIYDYPLEKSVFSMMNTPASFEA